MKILSHLVHAFKGTRSEDSNDYVPYETFDWREPLLVEAARKYGKPFKCAAHELPREVMLGGKDVVVVGVQSHPMQGSAGAAVVQSKRAQSVLARLSDSSILGLHRQRQRALHEAALEQSPERTASTV